MTGHHDVARDMAGAGWPVFPCLPANKRPATEHGFHDATTDPTTIDRWWGRHPDHLIGTPTEGLVVVDLDIDDGIDGRQWWEAQLDEHGDPPPGPVVTTPRGGAHLYYAAPPGGVRNSASKLGPGVDIRGDGGYVIAPGSVLPDGREYELAVVEQLHDAPDWLLEAIAATRRPAAPPAPSGPRPPLHPDERADRYARTAVESELGRLATAREGGRNAQLNESAFNLGQLVGAGRLDANTAAYDLLSVALRIGLGEHEASATIASGLRSGIARPRRATA